MASRFISNVTILIAGAVLVSAALGFGATAVVGWIGLGVGCLIAVTLLIAFAVHGRGIPQRAIDGVLALRRAARVAETMHSRRADERAPLGVAR